jgi:hypothetical protein
MKCACPIPRNCPSAALWLAPFFALIAACGKPTPFGEANSLIVVASDSLWAQVEESTYEALEQTFVTTRPEKKFVVTQVDPASPDFEKLRMWWQVIVFGTPDDPLVERVAQAAGLEGAVGAPSIVQAEDIWARGQIVTAVVLAAGRERESWLAQLPDLYELIDEGFRRYVSERMFVSGTDTVIADSLIRSYGFSLTVPVVYRLSADHNLVILRNDNPDPSELIRSVLVAWRPRVDSLTPELAYGWRAAVDSIYYTVPQDIDLSVGQVRRFRQNGHEALEATGTWADEPVGDDYYPAGGPFISWLVQCPDRTFFLDAWLYAPRRSKYMYVIQLREILSSFSCASGPDPISAADSPRPGGGTGSDERS